MPHTIALAMMAHNEARYLPIVQSNLGNRINSVCIISDPPNDDDTMIVAKEVFGHYANLKLIERPWPDQRDASSFCRNQVIMHAKTFGDDYVLWLDPDSPLVGTIPDELGDPIYAFLTVDRNSNISWWQPHLLRTDLNIKWKGAIHEYLDCGATPVQLLTTAKIDRAGSGGGVTRMKNWDLPLLLELVAENPNDPRHVYYLAQTYRDLADYPNAIHWYKRRAEMFGLDQETFYSIYMVGLCYLLMSDDANAESWLLKAYAYRPSRVEPLERLVELYQRQNQPYLAIQLLINGHRIPPSNDIHQVANRQLPA